MFYHSGVTYKKRNGGNKVSRQYSPPDSPGQQETTRWTVPNSQLSVLPLKFGKLVFAVKTTYMVCVQ